MLQSGEAGIHVQVCAYSLSTECAPEVSCLSPFSVSQQDHLQREGTDVLGHRKLS